MSNAPLARMRGAGGSVDRKSTLFHCAVWTFCVYTKCPARSATEDARSARPSPEGRRSAQGPRRRPRNPRDRDGAEPEGLAESAVEGSPPGQGGGGRPAEDPPGVAPSPPPRRGESPRRGQGGNPSRGAAAAKTARESGRGGRSLRRGYFDVSLDGGVAWVCHYDTHPSVQCSMFIQRSDFGLSKEKKSTPRTRNFACVVYPESAPKEWQDILCEQFVPAFVSPLHDSDINPGGEQKKAHYHVLLMFDSVKTTEQAHAIFEKIGGVGCEVVQSIRGYARYLCHLDNPEKAQYSVDDVRQLCGADYVGTIGLVTDKYKSIAEIIDFCLTEDIVAYSTLLEYARCNRFDWFRVLCDNGTVVVKEYLKSRTWDGRANVTRTNVRVESEES